MPPVRKRPLIASRSSEQMLGACSPTRPTSPSRVGRALQPGRKTLVGAQVALLAGEPALASYDVFDHALAAMGRSFLSEVAKTSILKTGLPTPISSPPSTGYRHTVRHPAQRLERSDLVLWHRECRDVRLDSGDRGSSRRRVDTVQISRLTQLCRELSAPVAAQHIWRTLCDGPFSRGRFLVAVLPGI